MRSLTKLCCILLLLLLAACGGTSAPNEDNSIEQYHLANGMKVILKPIDSVPVVAMTVWVHVGSKDETDATRGLAHIQEHMLFQGTESYPPGKVFQTVEGVGGSFNATTNYDRTEYHITMPKSGMETGLKILGSMMFEATIEEESLQKELEVVMEEFRRSRDDPHSVLIENLVSTIFTDHPYHHPVIGYEETIKAITRDQVNAFYQNWYVPENMTVVLVGDMDIDATKKLIKEIFGSPANRPNPKREIPPDTPQGALRTVILQKPFASTYLSLAFRNTPFDHKDTPALDLLYLALGDGASSRLVKHIRDELQLVTSIGASSYTPEAEGMGMITASLNSENAAAALEAIFDEVFRLRQEPISQEELRKVQLKIAADTVYEQESFTGIAAKLGFYDVITGDIAKEDIYLAAIRDLSPEDIMKIAQQYLVPEQLTIGLLYPEEEEIILTEEEIRDIVERSAEKKTEDIIRTQSYDEEANVTKVELTNGLTLLLREDHNVPTVSLQMIMRGGLRNETAEQNGISALTANLLMRGTDARDHEQIAQAVESIAGGMNPFSGRNSFGLSAQGLSEYNDQTLELFADALLHSTFPTDQIEFVRSLMLDSIERRVDSSATIARSALQEALYGEHPYARQPGGVLSTVEALTREDVMTFAEKHLVPEGAVLSMVGDIDTEETISRLATLFGSWKGSISEEDQDLPAPVFPEERLLRYTFNDKEQSHIYIGFPGITFENPDRHAFEVTTKILSGGGGRLFAELRDKESLAYTVTGMRIEGYQDPGYFAVYIGTEPSKTDQAMAGLERELQRMIEEDISDEELQRAIDFITGSFVISLQPFEAQASDLGFNEFYGLGYDNYLSHPEKIRSITKEDVRQIAETYFVLDQAALSVVGPSEPMEN